MAMNADLLVPGSNVFYLRGTTRQRVPAIVVGLSSFPECVEWGREGGDAPAPPPPVHPHPCATCMEASGGSFPVPQFGIVVGTLNLPSLCSILEPIRLSDLTACYNPI